MEYLHVENVEEAGESEQSSIIFPHLPLLSLLLPPRMTFVFLRPLLNELISCLSGSWSLVFYADYSQNSVFFNVYLPIIQNLPLTLRP